MKIILSADHASIDFGGEAALPCHYFRVLLLRNIDVHLLVHERSREFLEKKFYFANDRIHYVEDTVLHKVIYFFQRLLPDRIGYFTFGLLLRLLTQLAQKKIAKRIIAECPDVLVHEVIPVSPRSPSLMFGLAVPVVIGPLNGGMAFPHAFKKYDGRFSYLFSFIGRILSVPVNIIIPGKLLADVILVANERTEKALPWFIKGEVHRIVENGVDLDVWEKPLISNVEPDSVNFVYVGRLVGWKAVDILLEAFEKVCEIDGNIRLHIIGDGEKRTSLVQKVSESSLLKDNVKFHGWLQQSDIAPILSSARALTLPSLYECGGAVVLEAMACSIPVITTNWGGPADYLDVSCGILIDPTSRTDLVNGFTKSLIKLATNPSLAETMGKAGRKKVDHEFDWERKADSVINVYQSLLRKKRC